MSSEKGDKKQREHYTNYWGKYWRIEKEKLIFQPTLVKVGFFNDDS